MTEAAQQRTLEELRQELLLLRDLANGALKRFGFVESEPAPEPLPAPVTVTRTYQPDEMMSIAEVAAKLCVTERTIRKYVAQQEIPHRKLGTGPRPPVRFYRGEIDAWIDGTALEVIENGVKPVGMAVERVPVMNPRQGQPVQRTPQLKRRLSYT